MALIPIVPQPGQLLNLPENVLRLILQNVAQTSPIQLYVLAILAKRLNTLALPLFLARLGVSEPRRLVNLTLQPTSRRTPSSRLDALSGLRIALYVTSVDQIHCTFDFRDSAHDAFFQAIRRLGGFLSRLTTVSAIHLEICGGIQTFELHRDANTQLRWDAAFQQLSDTVTRKPGSRLVVTNAGYLTRSWVSSPTVSNSGSRRSAASRFDFPIRRLLGGEKQVYEAADARLAPPSPVARELHSLTQRRPRSLSQPCAPRVLLTSVTIDSQALLSQNLDWTLALLRSNTLASLSMSNVQLPGLMWSSILPQIAAAAPFLTHLDIADSNVFPKDLLSFLSKLPLLENLKIDRSLRLFAPASHPYPKLSHLSRLSAPPEYVAILLSVRGGLPHLRDLEIVVQNLSYVAAPHTAEAFQTIFNRLKESSPSVSPSPSTSPLPNVVSFTQHFHHSQQLIHTLNVYVGSSSVQANFMKSIDSALSLGADWQRRMRSFTHVVLDGFPLDEAARDSSVWAALPRWLGIMPEVEVVEIYGGDVAGNRREVGQGKALEAMVRAISNRCSKVRRVVINEVEHEVLGVTHFQPPAISRSRAPSPLPYAALSLPTTPIPAPSPVMNRSPSPLRQCRIAPGLPNLPEDIMDRIVSYLSTDLYPLSLVCRRLNMLAVSRLLCQHDVPNPAVKSHIVFRENPTAPDALTALQVAIHIPSIDHLSIKFPRSMTLFQFFDQLYRIRRLVARLTMLSKFTIDFGLGSNEHLKTANDALLARWTSLMEGLLNTVLEKSCHTLTVTGGAHFLGTYQLKKKREPFLFRDSGNPMKGNTWVFTRAPEQGSETIVAELSGRALTGQQPPPHPITPNCGPGASTNLRVLTIDSELLLRPPFLTWTIAAMRASPLARLELCELPNDLSVLLPVIAEAVPRLTELQISGDLNPEDVLEFIDKLPLLRSLSLGRTLYLDKADMESESIPLPKLRKLTHLTAPIEFIPFLLSQFLPQSSNNGNGNVTPPGGGSFIPPLKSLTIALPNPSLTSPSHITLANNILSISRLLYTLHLSPAISLDISVPPTTAWAARDISIVSCTEPRWENAMKVISNITLRNYDAMHYGIGDPTQPPNRVVPRWLALFPGLQTAVVVEKMQSEPGTFLPLVHSIMRSCPDLSSVQVNAKTYRPDHFRF
ncbi:hypothetical protein BDN72DRAFT_201137 [Pluteus cervinus]|uniref:Uncharacterized protein n=1 Tax=Pluteus cervinus TaxID=181527 RepID=A0ACD3B5R8_9AGAR|nr:hypothetical protein BDN72DRAFT_201137 [Pluteus cervinus]